MRLLLLLFPFLVYAYCFETAGMYYGVSPSLLYAIAKVESGLNANAINKNKDGSIDVGLMQINSRWFSYLRKHGIDPRWLFDPCYNVMVGAMVLRHCIDRYGLTWQAVDCYNKGSKAQPSSKYVWKVYKVLSSQQD